MRRMYSQNELEKLVKDVFLADVESGEIDFAGIMADALENMDVVAKSISADSIIEKMEGYSFTKAVATANRTFTYYYASSVKNGNKITFVVFGTINTLAEITGGTFINVGTFTIPSAVGSNLYPFTQGSYDNVLADIGSSVKRTDLSLGDNASSGRLIIQKQSDTSISFAYVSGTLVTDKSWLFRFEVTFLLADNMAS